MSKDMKECYSQHAIAHSLTGLGVGLILANYVSAVRDNLLMVGVIGLVVGVVIDMMRK